MHCVWQGLGLRALECIGVAVSGFGLRLGAYGFRVWGLGSGLAGLWASGGWGQDLKHFNCPLKGPCKIEACAQ